MIGIPYRAELVLEDKPPPRRGQEVMPRESMTKLLLLVDLQVLPNDHKTIRVASIS
jgi:hypothetical protein